MYKISLFDDDLIVTLSKPSESLQALKLTLVPFGEVSGLLMNKSKTLLYLINISDIIAKQVQRE